MQPPCQAAPAKPPPPMVPPVPAPTMSPMEAQSVREIAGNWGERCIYATRDQCKAASKEERKKPAQPKKSLWGTQLAQSSVHSVISAASAS